MAEDRMLSDEILLGLIKANSGGGGGGTSNYNDLSNKPQINGTMLTGNKSASDLGLVAAVDGKGLSTNDYTDADKAIVGGVTAALAGKQDALTAGKYIGIDANNEITVNREIPGVSASYELKTTSTSDPEINTDVIKRVNGEIVWQENYNYQTVRDNPVTIDDVFVLSYSGQWKYKLLVASDDHAAGYEQTWGWSAWVDYTENFSLVDNTGKKLIIKSELDTALAGKQNTLTFDDVPTDNSNNPVKSNGIYDALALKQNATDNSLDTTAKTIVGAINEHEGDIDSLKSGLTSVDVALSVPNGSGKNVLPLTLANIKSMNISGTWSDNAYTISGLTFTVQINSDGNVSGISANGTVPSDVWGVLFYLPSLSVKDGESYTLTGCPNGGGSNTYALYTTDDGDNNISDFGDGITYTTNFTGNAYVRIVIYRGTTVNNVVFYPMIRPATITDATFAPYIPSVESRIEAVESWQANLVVHHLATSQAVAAGSTDTIALPTGTDESKVRVISIYLGVGNTKYYNQADVSLYNGIFNVKNTGGSSAFVNVDYILL